MSRVTNIYPGEILLEEFLKPMGITPYRLAKETGIPQTRIGEIIRGVRSITAATALRFAQFLGTTPEFWINLQVHYDLEKKKKEIEKALRKIKPHALSPSTL